MTATLLGLDLTGRRVLVVGGGPIATRRAHTMLDGGAAVDVVAPDASDELTTLAATGRVTLAAREVVEADVDGAWLVHACAGDAAVDAAVAGWASERRVFCVVASDVTVGTARSTATAVVGDVLLGVTSTSGADPRRSVTVRDGLAEVLRSGSVDLRAHRNADAAPAGDPLATTSPVHGAVLRPGTVALLGGGTGDPDLMTVRARALLAQADVVVSDRLGPTSVLTELADDVEVIHVGKSPGIHQVPQSAINQILIDQAQAGRRVARLKGGDPFLFGRGGEEVLACRAAGVEVMVVPGVTSAVAAPLIAGIPVTHRGTSGRVHIVNGHGRLTPLDLAAIGAPDVTTVILMGLAGLERLAHQALTAGIDPTTPVAVVVRATLPGEQVVRAALDGIVAACAEAGLTSTGVIVMGTAAREGFLEPGTPGEAPVPPPTRKQLREMGITEGSTSSSGQAGSTPGV